MIYGGILLRARRLALLYLDIFAYFFGDRINSVMLYYLTINFLPRGNRNRRELLQISSRDGITKFREILRLLH